MQQRGNVEKRTNTHARTHALAFINMDTQDKAMFYIEFIDAM
jgi:hypothetical protein